MKKAFVRGLIILLVVAVAICAWFYGYYHQKNPDNIPSKALMVTYLKKTAKPLRPKKSKATPWMPSPVFGENLTAGYSACTEKSGLWETTGSSFILTVKAKLSAYSWVIPLDESPEVRGFIPFI